MHEKLIRQIEALIEADELIIWIHGKHQNYLVPAVSVCMNGRALQIEGAPDWVLDSDEAKARKK